MTQTFHQPATESPDASDLRPFTDDGLPRTLWWDATVGVLRLIDQTLLPDRCEVLTCADAKCVAEAIRALRVRGAPAIGVAAAYGLALGVRSALIIAPPEPDAALARITASANLLRATRPTAINLAWALDRMLAVARAHLAAHGDIST
ncbi:MAG: hypothetical protein ACRDHP_13840, partial [Ktedonobacterales bacterium]